MSGMNLVRSEFATLDTSGQLTRGSASSDEHAPVESASQVEANRKVSNESDQDQASVVMNAPVSDLALTDDVETDAVEALNALMVAGADADDGQVDRDLLHPPSPSAPSASEGAMHESTPARPSTPQPEASAPTGPASASPSGSSPIFVGIRRPTQDSPRRVVIRNIPRTTAEPVPRLKMPSYTVLEVFPVQPPPPAGPYRTRR